MRQIFYAPDIATNPELPEEESGHCVRVLRMVEGDELLVTDGRGYFYEAVIRRAHPKRCEVEVQRSWAWRKPWPVVSHVAVAPTKNMDRMEWFVEKAMEIGIDAITFLNCRFSERRMVKLERVEKILVSAMKQSQKALLPTFGEMTPLERFLEQPFEGRKFIAHCQPGEKKLLKATLQPGENALILIGPEGDFSPEEIRLALERGFEPISLGESRLRTETAALVACLTVQLINQ